MLTIRAMTGGAGYAQKHLEHSDYFDQNLTVQGEWHGRGAELLGLNGTVTHEQFEAVREGLHPETGDSMLEARIVATSTQRASLESDADRIAGPCCK